MTSVPGMPSVPGADAAVRSATGADAEAVGAVHVRSWTASYSDVLPAAVLSGLDARGLASAWRPAIAGPPTSRHRVLVSTATDLVTGFAALAPAEDPDTGPDDAELVAFEVDPAHRRTGHGSRLLNAVADTARDLGFARLVTWAPEVDDPRIAFLRGAGAAPDGARRVRAPDTGLPDEWVEVRLVATLADDPTGDLTDDLIDDRDPDPTERP